MRILLTGAGGFIGRNLKESLIHKYDLYALGRSDLDLNDQKNVFSYLKKHSFDVVIHCANANNVVYKLTEYDVLNQNLQMFYNLERCHSYYGKMYYFGSGAEFDMNHYIPRMKESYFDTFIPQDAYGFSKYTMARIAEYSTNIYNLRLFGVYGKYEEWKRRFISNNLCKSLKNRDMTINKNVRFDYLYVNDLCKIMEWFIEHTPHFHHYNVCTGNTFDLYTIANKINQVTGLKRTIQVLEEGWKSEYSGDNQRLKGEIGTIHFTDINTAIYEMYCYYQSILKYIEL